MASPRLEILPTEMADPASHRLAHAATVAVLLPCFNEERAIAGVVGSFRLALPTARIYVYDNNSTDGTVAAARAAGAIVRHERMQGKGHVVRRMFADIDADVYVLADGDGTYDAAQAPELVAHLLEQGFDLLNGARVDDRPTAYRPGHRLGNTLLTAMVGLVFGNRFNDMLSGYKLFSRRFAKSFPALADGFEIETELTIHALQLSMPVGEVATRYSERAAGSVSKLRTFRDGFRILGTIGWLIKEERPMAFFGLGAALLALVSLGLAIPIFITFAETGLVPRLPTALLSTGLMLLAFLSLASGLVLDTVTHGRKEMKRLHYLSLSGPSDRSEG
jgi:glycosyltransferase involved in cell wall biosynthesis